MAIVPDDKDWTWVLQRRCSQCGFDATATPGTEVARWIRETADAYVHVLTRPGARRRPAPDTWSPTEYACHVRDVHRVFGERVRLMLDQDDPQFENWDQDRTAVEERYADQHPDAVSDELVRAAAEVADLYDAVPAGAWDRRGRRSNGSVFTVDSLARYHLHDVVHHLWDIRETGAGATST